MEFKHTETKLKELSKKFTDDLVQLLTDKGHNDTGALANSIIFSFSKIGNDYKIELNALEYIQYLEDGTLIKNFLKLKTEELDKEIKKEFKKDILNELIKD